MQKDIVLLILNILKPYIHLIKKYSLSGTEDYSQRFR
jgi:hypothetical protein